MTVEGHRLKQCLIASSLIIMLTLTLIEGRAMAELSEAPTVPFRYALGMDKFKAQCAECHGQWAEGTDQGPPLRHPYYLPGHHSDAAFYRAILKGSAQHHWDFGDMPPMEGATPKDAQQITEFVRWLQEHLGMLQ